MTNYLHVCVVQNKIIASFHKCDFPAATKIKLKLIPYLIFSDTETSESGNKEIFRGTKLLQSLNCITGDLTSASV